MAEGASDKKSPYEILGVGKYFSARELKAARNRLLREGDYRHGDLGGDDKKAAEINKAYETLADSAKRGVYDANRKPSNVRPRNSPSYIFGPHRCKRLVQLAQA